MNEEQLSQIIRDVIAKQGGTTMNLSYDGKGN